MFELDLLGPVTLRRDGRVLPVTVKKSQALLLVLALGGRRGREPLSALLWPTLDSASARRNLRRELARLRDCGAEGLVHADGDTLALVDAVVCDARVFADAVRQGDPEAALALWHGEPGAELRLDADDGSFDTWLVAQRKPLADLRHQALAAAAAQHEATGVSARAIDHLNRLLADDPLQERHHRALIRVLLGAGRREDALAQYLRCRDLLVTELGLQPMAETDALLVGVWPATATATAARPAAPAVAGAMAAAPASAAATVATSFVPQPAAAPWSTPSPTAGLRLPAALPFVGRDEEIQRLQAAWSAGRALLLVGEAGVGKTRLATDFAAAQGPHALVRCHPGDRDLAFGAFARALRTLCGQPADLRGLDGWIVTELTRLLPELGPAPQPLHTEAERLRFDEACLQAWASMAGDAFDAVVLDDWQHADPASQALLARVAARRREAGRRGAIELVVWRAAGDDPALSALADTLGAVSVTLGPLPPAAVYQLVQRLSGATDPARFVDRLCRATGGHPFFIAETLRDLAEKSLLASDEHGRWQTPFDSSTEDYRELPMPTSVRDAVLARVQRLGPAAGRLLEAAALAGEPFGVAWLASACALSELEAVQALEQAEQAQLVRAHDGGGYAWVHDLGRQALVSVLAPTRRRLVHHRLALAAEGLGASAEAARHFEACGERRRAVAHRLAAGDAARALMALDEAARHWHQGLADEGDPAAQAALLARTLDADYVSGRAAEAEAACQRLLGILDSAVLPEADAVEAGHALARHLQRSDRADAALALLDRLPAAGESSRLRRLILRMGSLHQRGRIHEALALGDQALAMAPPTGPDAAELLIHLAMLAHAAGHLQTAVAHVDRYVVGCRQRGDDIGLARGLYLRGAYQSERSEPVAAESDLREAAALAGRYGDRNTQRMALYNLGAHFAGRTRPDDALAVAREGWPLCASEPASEIAAMFRALFVDAHFVRGEWGLAWAHIEPAIEAVLHIGQPMSTAGVAMAVLEPMAMLGQWSRAAGLLAALDGDELAQSPQAGNEVWLACAVAALLRGDAAEAGAWLARLGTAESIENPRIRQRLHLLVAQRQWLLGDAAGALATLPADDAPGMSDELRLRALALRCRMGADAASVERARAVLATALPDAAVLATALPDAAVLTAALPDAAARATALPDATVLAALRPHAAAVLELAQAVGGDGLSRQVQHLAAGLSGWPAVRAGFLATWQ